MDDERISRLLRSLPRDEASPYFTAAVLRRLKTPPPRAKAVRRLALAAGAAVMLAAGIFGVQEWSEERALQQARQEALARLDALEAEKRALEAEIATLSRMARDAQPVVYLGSTPNLDVVVDMSRLAQRRSRWTQGRIRPAVGRPDAAPSTRYVTLPQSTRKQGENR